MFASLQVESHAAGVAAAKAAAAEKAASAAENGAGAGPIDEAVVEENDEYEVSGLSQRTRLQLGPHKSLHIVLLSIRARPKTKTCEVLLFLTVSRTSC